MKEKENPCFCNTCRPSLVKAAKALWRLRRAKEEWTRLAEETPSKSWLRSVQRLTDEQVYLVIQNQDSSFSAGEVPKGW